MVYDENQDYSYVKDSEEATVVQSRGEDVFITTEGTTSHYRQVGTRSYADWLIEDDGSDAPDWFSEPSARFAPTCTSYAGSAAYQLTYAAGAIREQWVFSTTGTLLSANYVDTVKSTSIQMTFSPTSTVRSNPTGVPKAAFIELSLLSEGETASGWYQNLRVESGTFFEYYSGIDVDLYSGETMVAELKGGNGYASAYGSVTFVDSGQIGVLDAGDLVQLTATDPVDSYWFYNAWSETYFEESVLDEPAAPEGTEDPTQGGTISKHYEWAFQGGAYEWDMDIPVSLLKYYAGLSFTYKGNEHDYQGYVNSYLDDEYIQDLADGMLEFGKREGLDEDEILSMTLAFVQSLEYTADDVTTGYDEYPRYPLETLAEDGGDCEDTSILFASLSLAMGYDTVMVSPPGHMAVGLASEASAPGGGYSYQGTKYLFAETTGEGYEFGDVPTPYAGQSATIYPLNPTAVLVIEDLSFVVEDGFYHVKVSFANDGIEDSASGRATVYGFNSAKTYYFDSDYCTFDLLEAGGAEYTCEFYIRVLPTIESIEAVVETDDGLYGQTY